MKTFNKLSAVLMTCLMVVLSGFVFTACNDDNDVDTNQFTGGVKPVSYTHLTLPTN